MPIVTITTIIKAPIEIVFDLSRSIDLHQVSTLKTNERAIAGRTRGLIELDESVTWQAKHFGITQQLTSRITSMHYPNSFIDEMTKGIFAHMHHQHLFTTIDAHTTMMVDIFDYAAPLPFLGKMAEILFLTNYMRKLLQTRNECIKAYAESGDWQKVLR